MTLALLGRHAEAAEDARRALAVAREIVYPLGQVLALEGLAFAAAFADDLDGAVRLARQAGQITAGVPGVIARWCSFVLAADLMDAGDLAAAETVCAAALTQARDTGDLHNQALLPAAPGTGKLSTRERELVTLVAQGRTDAQIAAQLHISIRTVRSHLDRIRDKTGCRRRADLTRLALGTGLV